ncbi:oxidoreductase [Rhodofomes roseus]|uniref:Oxidoreductase n=1 Tax=Rhodofomes roseus TaxID=34475 RepID=A0ABQ8K4L3_9APHY|nr:oxidoreductase [Rhodofomes roseus]KAH9831434.1 oxidoreductase [Rhodofomes roseus]
MSREADVPNQDGDSDHAKAQPWSSYVGEVFLNRKPPLVPASFHKLESAAREAMAHSPEAFEYISAGAGTGSTLEANREEFRKWRIIPQVLNDVRTRSLETTLFGVKYPSPLIVAPMGLQSIVHADGECATAEAAGKVGVPFCMSTASSRSIEAIAKANGTGPRWFMLYWGKEEEVTLSLLARAKRGGFTALVMMVDGLMHGYRSSDLDTAYFPVVHAVGMEVGLSDPAFMGKLGLEPFPEDVRPAFPYDPRAQDELVRKGDAGAVRRAQCALSFLERIIDTGKTWDDVAFLRQHWDGPIVLKGILSVKDAERAIDCGVEGIGVSNHGGRQIDGAIPSLRALRKIVQSPKVKAAQPEESGRFTVLMDSGIRRSGSDVFKAIASGAQGILYGRPVLYSLAVGGAAGVESQLRDVLSEFDTTLGLSGFTNVEDLRRHGDEILERDP